jgi:hypothetical protein
MGRFCILCARVRPNEAVGGKREQARISADGAMVLPSAANGRTRRDAMKCEHEIVSIPEQSHVSDKN